MVVPSRLVRLNIENYDLFLTFGDTTRYCKAADLWISGILLLVADFIKLQKVIRKDKVVFEKVVNVKKDPSPSASAPTSSLTVTVMVNDPKENVQDVRTAVI